VLAVHDYTIGLVIGHDIDLTCYIGKFAKFKCRKLVVCYDVTVWDYVTHWYKISKSLSNTG